MKKRKIVLDQNWFDVKTQPGDNFISEIEVILDIPKNKMLKELGALYIALQHEQKTEKLQLKSDNCTEVRNKFVFRFDKVLELNNESTLAFRHMEVPDDYKGTCEIRYTLSEVPKITIDDPMISFKSHLDNFNNTKIVFSAPFGEGKTTFLNYFFEENQNAYDVFRVFPVNYSIASNEDIFRYVKSDILFQLLGKDIKFDESSISIIDAFKEYVYLNPKKTIFSFLKNISHLNKEAAIISKSVDALNDFLKPVLEYHEQQEIDNRSAIENYVQEIYEKEGSLFEDNFYSQLIRELLIQLNEKRTVLVIEDLDRMDPEHVFRILNVVSAHYDSNNFEVNSLTHNKFGFDKIIVVCDVKNIQAIFEHRYGSSVDFNGYFNKFFSSKPFLYNNENMLKTFVKTMFSIENQRLVIGYIEAIVFLVEILVENGFISLRELIKLKEYPYDDFLRDGPKETKYTDAYARFKKSVFSFPLLYLNEFYSGNLISIFEVMRNLNLRYKVLYEYWSGELLAGLPANRDASTTFNDGKAIYSIKRSEDYNFEYWKADEIKLNGQTPDFSDKDFFHLLMLTYKQMKSVIR